MTTRKSATTSHSRATLAASAIAALTLLGGCTNDTDQHTPTGSASSTASTTPSAFVPSVQSALVLNAQLPAVAGSAKGTLNNQEVTLNVAQVRATSHGTLLTYWYTGPDTGLLPWQGEKSWENQPVLGDTTGKKVYQPFTFVNTWGETLCLCTDGSFVLDVPQPRTVYYPALPESVTTIEVRREGVDKPITVPVTR